jgi:hypothetical protein
MVSKHFEDSPRPTDRDCGDNSRRAREADGAGRLGLPAGPAICACGCGESLVGKRRHAKYHNEACKKRAKRRRNNAHTRERKEARRDGLGQKYTHRQRQQANHELQKLGVVPSRWEFDQRTGKKEPEFDNTPEQDENTKPEERCWKLTDGWWPAEFIGWLSGDSDEPEEAPNREHDKPLTKRQLAEDRRWKAEAVGAILGRYPAVRALVDQFTGWRDPEGRGVHGELEEAGRLWRSVYVDGGAMGTPGGKKIAYGRRCHPDKAHKRSQDQFPKPPSVKWSKVDTYRVPPIPQGVPWETVCKSVPWKGDEVTTAELAEQIEAAKEEIISTIIALHGHPVEEAEEILEDSRD